MKLMARGKWTHTAQIISAIFNAAGGNVQPWQVNPMLSIAERQRMKPRPLDHKALSDAARKYADLPKLRPNEITLN